MSIEVLSSRRSALGESPRWDDRSDAIVWLDISAGSMLSVTMSGGVETTIDVGAPCGSLVLHRDGGVALAVGDSWMRPQTGLLMSAKQPEMRFNDGGVDSSGTIWSATMRTDESISAPARGALYRVSEPLTPVITGLIAGNGVAFSPDERFLYLVDSGTNTIVRADFDVETARVGVPHPWVHLSEGIADGIAVDADGGIWVAVWGTGCVRRYSEVAALTHSIRLPTSQVTAITFGGPALDTLVVTTAAMDTDARHDPLAGALFALDAPVHGLALHRTNWE